MAKQQAAPPQQPDPAYVSRQQTQSNVNTAVANSWLNNINQKTPQGSLTYNQTGTNNVGGIDVPSWEAVTTLSPDQQKLYDTGTRTAQGYADLGEGYISQIRDATKTPFSYAGMPAAPTAPKAPGRMVAPTPSDVPTYDDGYQNKVYNQMLDRAAPQQERDRAALQNRLANQGIPNAGSEAGDAEWANYNEGINDFRATADLASGDAATQRYQNQLQGQGQGWGQEAQRFGMDMQANDLDWRQQGDVYGYQGADRDRAINDALRLRQLPINEASALFSLGSGVQGPQFVNTPQNQVSPTDVSGIYANDYAGKMAAYNQRQQSGNAAMGGLFGLAGTLGGAALGGPWGASAGGFLGGLLGRR